MKFLKILSIISLFVILLLCTYSISQPIKDNYNSTSLFPKTVDVINKDYDKKIDTVIMTLSYYVFGYDTLHVLLIMSEMNDDYISYTSPYLFDHSYVIIVDETIDYKKMKYVLCHEFIHIEQLESKDLILPLGVDYPFVYKGDTIPYSTKYSDRQWEKDAYNKTDSILNLLNSYL
jgi:hypothetical protein